MISYILRRLMASIPIVFLIMFIGFVLMELPPGDYATYYVAQMEAAGASPGPGAVEQIRRIYGLDEPFYARFFQWVFNFVRGDFGHSFAYNQPVRSIIGERLLLTVVISLVSMAFAWIIGIPIGVYSATHQYKAGDHFFTLMAFLGVGIPDFMLALVLLVIGSRYLGFVPMGLFSREFQAAPWSIARVIDLSKHMVIPALIIAVTGTAGYMRTMRGNLLDVFRLDYVQTARAKGLSENTVVWKHAVRNAIHPLVMSFGMSFPQVVSGSAIVGIVLNLPIMGPMYLQAVRRHDIYLGGTLLVLVTLMLVVGNLVADILLAVIDPRVRYQ